MAPNPEVLPILFRKDRNKAGEVIAVFPTVPADSRGTLTIYAHLGQHGGGSWRWYTGRTHRPATPEEYGPLLRELQSIYGRSYGPGDGVYTLKVYRKMTPAHRAAFWVEVERGRKAGR